MDIDESHGLSGPPCDGDEDDDRPTASDRYELDHCDRQDWHDNMREDARISNR